MKKTLLTFAAILFVALSMNAQDLTLSWDGETLGDTVVVWGDPTSEDFEIVFHAVCQNNTDDVINVKIRRKRIEMLEGTMSTFCWGICYAPDIEVSPDSIPIAAQGQSEDEAFSGHYTMAGVIGTSIVEYTFFNQYNEDQNVKVVAKYWASPTGIAEDAMNGGSISDIYPNPATTFVNLDYNMPAEVDFAKVQIVNLLGSVVKESNINRSANKLSMDVSDLQGGIYFYSVLVNGDVYKTKKLVIQN